MLAMKLFSSITSMVNTVAIRTFRPHKNVRFPRGINQPPMIYKPYETNIKRMPDEETRIWKEQISLYRIDKRGPLPRRKRLDPLGGAPQLAGLVLKTLIKKPKKPNSANRKCVLVRLSSGKEVNAYVPGIGHNLQEHSRVLVKKHRVKDVPGLKLRVIRGVYDCSLVIKRSQS